MLLEIFYLLFILVAYCDDFFTTQIFWCPPKHLVPYAQCVMCVCGAPALIAPYSLSRGNLLKFTSLRNIHSRICALHFEWNIYIRFELESWQNIL